MLGVWKEGKYYIEGLEYIFPKKPANKDIINFGKPRNFQKWSRITDYEQYDWTKGWEERLDENPEQLQYLIDEVGRINNGLWVYINGEPTYLNADMYFFIQWYMLPDTGEYPEYRDTSLYYYRFLEIVDKSPNCTGHTLIKGRRLGATSMIISRLLRKLITVERKNFGITSKSTEDANSEGAFGFLTSAFENLPHWLKPEVEDKEATKKVLSLRAKPTRGSEKTEAKGLFNKAFWRAPGMNTFDSGAYEEVLADESGKYDDQKTKVNIHEYIPILTRCVKKGSRVTGKLHLPTTVNPPDRGGANYRKVWDDSNQENADEYGRTVIGLYRIFIGAEFGYEGWVGEFGESIVSTPTPEQTEYLKKIGCPDPTIGSREYLQKERDKLKNRPKDLQLLIGMAPFNADEVFESANDRCIFDLKELNEREEELKLKLQEEGLDISTGELGRRGKFYFTPNGRVKFIDDSEGLWYVHRFLKDNESNKFEIINGKQTPANQEFGAAGLDPIFSGDAAVDAGSDASCIIRARFSSMDEDNTGIPVAMLIGRMADTNKLYEQVFAGVVYYGVKLLGERSTESWIKWAENNKLDNYILGTKRSDGTEVKGISAQQTTNIKNEHAEAQVLSSLHDNKKIPFIRLIRDRQAFNVDKRTKFDACMADGYALMAEKAPFKVIKKENVSVPFLRKGSVIT